MDVWFTKYGGKVWCVTSKHDEPPTRTPFLVRDGAKQVLSRIRKEGKKVESVGILPPDILGLE